MRWAGRGAREIVDVLQRVQGTVQNVRVVASQYFAN